MASSKATETEGNSQAGADENRARRRARSLVNEVLLGVANPLERRGIANRFLPGLWHATMNVVLSCFERDDVLALLMDRSRGMPGEGTNHDAPPRTISAAYMAQYVGEVELAATTIMEAFDLALDRMKGEDLEDRFPETVLDASLQVLLQAWGPAHVRRALAEQAALVIRGVPSPVNFMEPCRLQSSNGGLHRKDRPEEARLHVDTPAEARAGLADVSPPQRERVSRHVTAYAATDVDASGAAVWAIAMSSHDDEGRSEIREICGTLHDPAGRAVALRAIREAVLAACEASSRASVLIETSSGECLKGVSEADRPGARLPGEEVAWSEIDRARAVHRIEFRHVPQSIDRDLAERCDRMLRDKLRGSVRN